MRGQGWVEFTAEQSEEVEKAVVGGVQTLIRMFHHGRHHMINPVALTQERPGYTPWVIGGDDEDRAMGQAEFESLAPRTWEAIELTVRKARASFVRAQINVYPSKNL